MSIFSRLSAWFGGDTTNPEEGQQSTGPGTYATDSGISVTDEKALQLSGVWSCTQIIVDSLSSIPLRWHREKGGERTPLETGAIYQLFKGRPNKYMKMRDFRRCLTLQLALWNNAYAKIDWFEDRPVAITPLHPARMEVHRDEHGLTYHYNSGGDVHVFADKSILHLKGMSAEGVVGLDRSDFARNTYGVAASANKYAAKQFANGGKPGGVLKVDKFLKPDQRAALAKIYEGISATADGANKLWVLEGGVDFESIAHDPNTMQMLETRQFQLGDIARFFGVPAVLIGAGTSGSSSWPASFEQQQLAFLTFTLSSYLSEWEAALIDALVLRKDLGKIVVDHDEDDFIKMDSKAKAEFLSKMTQNGMMDRNEGRKKLRLPARDGADDLTAQVNLTTLDKLGETDGGEPDGDEDTSAI